MKLDDLVRSSLAAARAENIPVEGVPAGMSDDELLASMLGEDPRLSKMQEQQQALAAQLATMQQQARAQEATTFARAQVAARKALPREEAPISAAYLQALTDDARDSGQRASQLTALYAARPAHMLSAELVGDQALVALAPTAGQVDPGVRRKQLLNMTALGRSVLRAATA